MLRRFSWLSRRDSDGTQNVASPSRRSFQRARTFSSINFSVDKTIGWKIRDFLGSLERNLGPHLKKIFPSFVSVHYFYTIMMSLVGSVMLYPVKNMRYIDALFFSVCSATQAGLNTIDVNKTTLYQQIVIALLCCLSTPIFIHGSLTFLRLYWFERYFDDIRTSSKLNFKMRRTATMAARTQSMERHKTFDSQKSSRNVPTVPQSQTNSSSVAVDSPDSKAEDDTSSSELASSTPNKYTQSAADSYNLDEAVQHLSEPSDEDDNVPSRNDNHDERDDGLDANQPTNNIKFGELPKPRRHDVEPRDVYMSISMMRNNKLQKPQEDEEYEGPALVIKGPAEREKKPRRKNSAIHFDLSERPERRERAEKQGKMIPRGKRSGLRRSFIFNRYNQSEGDEDEDEDDGGEADDEEQSNSHKDGDDGTPLERARTYLQLPSSDQTAGVKFTKRSNTLDVPPGQRSNLKKSPTFERLVKKKLMKPTKQFRRRLSSSVIADESSMNYSDTDSDENSENTSVLNRQMSTSYLSWDPQIGRNSKFINLSDQQKEELGGVEYRAVKLLSKIVTIYYIGFHLIGFVFLVPWINTTKRYQPAVRDSGVSLTWWGFFTSMSAFNDLGFTLTPDSMISFRTSPYALLVTAAFIVIGNTGFPILLRFIIWVLFKFAKDLSLFKESLGFLLDHPRRCFTLLFPSAPTWWLLFILVALNVVDLVLFIILDIGSEVLDGLTVGQKVLDGFYQAVSTRTAGFACVDLSQLHPSVQVSYMVMMYISVLPLAISIRRTNVYEEQSLGVYMGHNNDDDDDDHDAQKATSFIGAHLRKQLSFDLWFVFLGLFIICIAEGGKLQNNELPDFNIFRVMFEVVSAYGTVGLSLGYPNTTPSFSGEFTVISKLVIIAMMIRGRMRGLPYSLDRSIILPSARMDRFDKLQELQAGNRLAHSETVGSANDPVLEFFKSAAPAVIRDRIRRPSFFVNKPSFSRQNTGRQGSQGTHGNINNLHFQHNLEEEEDPSFHLNQIPTNSSAPHGRVPSGQASTEFANVSYNSPVSSMANNDLSVAPDTLSPRADGEEFEMGYFSGHHSSARNSF